MPGNRFADPVYAILITHVAFFIPTHSSASQMHRTYLAGIERALRNPSLENLVKLANALDTLRAELFSTTPHAEAQQRRDP